MIGKKAIEEVIEELPFVNINGEIVEDNSIKKFRIETNTESGEFPLRWQVCINSLYPFKVKDSESIHFFNTSLIEYPHIMRSGFLCLHTPKVENPKEQFKIDLMCLKEWIDKYYIGKERDDHYEELVVERKPIDNIYYNFLYTDTDKEIQNNDYGTVDLTMLVPDVHEGKRMDTFMVNAFQSQNGGGKINCQWRQRNEKQMNYEGIYCFLENTPSVYNKFIMELYTDMSSLFSWKQMNFLYKWSLGGEKGKRVPLFCGYKIPTNELRWQVLMLKTDDFPLETEKIRCGGRPIINHRFKKVLIDWAYSYNCSYDYFFGRGCLPLSLAEKKILVIGIGAIGSIVAKTFTRCGAKYIDIYDVDLKEPGNICRSEYDFLSGVSDKTYELYRCLHYISPFVQCEIPNQVLDLGIKLSVDDAKMKNTIQELLGRYDFIFDCTTDDGLMYALDKLNINAKIINISISNHANELVCAIGRKVSKTVKLIFEHIVKSDTTDMFYPTGCWSPTFKASYNDIAAKLQFALKHIIKMMSSKEVESNFYISETEDGMKINRI